jgi:hypothetical protein
MSHAQNNRPDFQSWMRLIQKWNHTDADFCDAFSCQDPTVLTRLATDPGLKVIKTNVSSSGRSTLMLSLRPSTIAPKASKKKRRRHTAQILIDLFEHDGEYEANVFIKASSLKALTAAVLKAQPLEDGVVEPIPLHPSAGEER